MYLLISIKAFTKYINEHYENVVSKYIYTLVDFLVGGTLGEFLYNFLNSSCMLLSGNKFVNVAEIKNNVLFKFLRKSI